MNTSIEPESIVINLNAEDFILSDFRWHHDTYGDYYTASFTKATDPNNANTSGVTSSYFEIEQGWRVNKAIQVRDLEKMGWNEWGAPLTAYGNTTPKCVVGISNNEDTQFTDTGRDKYENRQRPATIEGAHLVELVAKAENEGKSAIANAIAQEGQPLNINS